MCPFRAAQAPGFGATTVVASLVMAGLAAMRIAACARRGTRTNDATRDLVEGRTAAPKLSRTTIYAPLSKSLRAGGCLNGGRRQEKRRNDHLAFFRSHVC